MAAGNPIRFVAFLLAIVLAPWLSVAAEVDRIDVIGYGILANKGGVQIGIGSGGIPEVKTTGDHIVATTDVIPACLGTEFGIEFRVIGKPIGADAGVVIVTRFPLPGLAKPGVAEPILVNRYPAGFVVGGLGYSSYSFDNPWELAPGLWTLELWVGDRQLASHAFTVVRQSASQSNHTCRGAPIT